MGPVLFLFLMSAVAETLELEWKKAGIKVLTIAHSPDDEINSGCVRGHTPQMYTLRKLTAYEIFQLLYVNDGAFPFPTCTTLIDELALIHSHRARFGLEVHIGRNGKPSKTECVFFPPPQNSSPTTRMMHIHPSPTTKMNPCSPPLPQAVHYASQDCKNLSKPALQERTPNMTHSQRHRRLT